MLDVWLSLVDNGTPHRREQGDGPLLATMRVEGV